MFRAVLKIIHYYVAYCGILCYAYIVNNKLTNEGIMTNTIEKIIENLENRKADYPRATINIFKKQKPGVNLIASVRQTKRDEIEKIKRMFVDFFTRNNRCAVES